MLALVVQNHPHRAGPDLGRKLVAGLLRHGSTFSGVGASTQPGAVHNRGLDARLGQAFGVLDRDVLAASVAVMNEASARHGPTVMKGLFQRVEYVTGMRGP